LADKVEQMMGWVVPDADACRRLAMEVRTRDPNAPPEEMARQLVKYAQKQGATIGGVTGVLASPLTFMPAALADMAAMMKVEGTMAGGIAALLDPASLDDPERFRADVLAVVFPAALSQALRQLGVRAGEQLTKSLVRRAVGKGSFEAAAKLSGRFLGAKLTGRALATKGVPLVGVGIGAGWNWLEVQAVGARAIAYHTGQPLVSGRLRELGLKLLPGRVKEWVGRDKAEGPPPVP
ncbi:MAG: hypothetical protein JWO31_3299, partial [Phycisphaerales bacterium]|nr:hypothetical protein [Phycisphaerales bacterium]